MQVRDLRAKLRPRTRAREFAEAMRTRRVAAQYAGWRDEPIEQGTVLYESFFGNGALDNPEAIFRQLLDDPEFAHLSHIWVLDDLTAHPAFTDEFAGHDRVRFVGIETPDYLQALATSQYLINNSTFPQEFAKREGQVYVNTWHGVPLKHMGYDMPGGGIESRNISRNFLNADYLISANPFMTDVMYRRAYRLQGIFPGAVIEEGQPRVDLQVRAMADPEPVLARLEAEGVRTARGKKVVLFAPTWRGSNFNTPQVNAGELVGTVRSLQKQLGDDYVVLLKTHQAVHNAVRARAPKARFLVSNDIPTNSLLGIADLLVTDYSSIFFDYLATHRPVVHYVPDLEDYSDNRGLYLQREELFGDFVQTVDDLAEAITAALAGDGTSSRVVQAAATYNAKEDGSAAARVVDIVFRGADESKYTVRRDFGTDKEKVCIYLGSMMSNGITTSALSLMANLDYDKYDVTAYWAYSKGRERARNAAMVDPRARVIPRATVMIGKPSKVAAIQRQMLTKGLGKKLSAEHLKFWRTEWTRLFGDAEFDHLVDFSGYGCYSPFLFTAAKGDPVRSIWLHNDLAADQQRETVGEKHLEDRLGAVFSTYRYFDHLVSVSPALRDVNAKGLAEHAPPEKFTSAVNTINATRVLQMAGRLRDHDGDGDGDATPNNRAATATFDTTNVAAAVATLLRHFKAGEIIRETRSRERIAKLDNRTEDAITFVTVGRLSPEKNHARLIDAFAEVHGRHPKVRLIILGSGKLEPQLHEQIASLGLEPFVSLAGQVDNPFAILADADCFVLSSDYEGQPMVILEARTLGLPVVTTAFGSVGDSVPDDAGIVVPRSVAGLVEGMEMFLAGQVPAHELDHAAYNAEAVAQFERSIGLRTAPPA